MVLVPQYLKFVAHSLQSIRQICIRAYRPKHVKDTPHERKLMTRHANNLILKDHNLNESVGDHPYN
jgi:hypothetical protein